MGRLEKQHRVRSESSIEQVRKVALGRLEKQHRESSIEQVRKVALGRLEKQHWVGWGKVALGRLGKSSIGQVGKVALGRQQSSIGWVGGWVGEKVTQVPTQQPSLGRSSIMGWNVPSNYTTKIHPSLKSVHPALEPAPSNARCRMDDVWNRDKLFSLE